MASSMVKQAVAFVFIISTIYGLVYYWNMGTSENVTIDGIGNNDGTVTVNLESDNTFSSLITNALDSILEFVSWFSLFSIVKGVFYIILPDSLYTPINLFLLRPTGWIASLITTEWVINKVRGTSEN